MPRSRMEAFSDGVLAIIITVMLLKLKTPDGFQLDSIKQSLPTLICYVMSYLYVGIYWTNHHHLVGAIDNVSGKILWGNLHWLFWMSLIPLVTEWIGEFPFKKFPTFYYGLILFMCALSYHLLQSLIIKVKGKESLLAKSIGKDLKGRASILLYGVAMIFSIYVPTIAYVIYIVSALFWIIPDIRIESILKNKTNER